MKAPTGPQDDYTISSCRVQGKEVFFYMKKLEIDWMGIHIRIDREPIDGSNVIAFLGLLALFGVVMLMVTR